MGIDVEGEGGRELGVPLGVSGVPFVVFKFGSWASVGMEVEGEAESVLPPVSSATIVASESFLASVPCAGTMTAGRGATGSRPTTGAGEIGERMVDPDAAADTGEGGIIASSFLQVYTVLMMGGGVSVAVVVDRAAVKIVVCVSTMVMMGSEILFGASAVIHAVVRSLENVISLGEVMRTLRVFGIRGFEMVKVLWLDEDAAAPLTEGEANVGSLSAFAALASTYEPVATVITGVTVCGIVLTS